MGRGPEEKMDKRKRKVEKKKEKKGRREKRKEKRKKRKEKREKGIGIRDQGTGNREQGTQKHGTWKSQQGMLYVKFQTSKGVRSRKKRETENPPEINGNGKRD